MKIFPAIDIFEGQAVRLVKGDYEQKTVYSDDPSSIARDLVACGASHIHVVDLEGARSGGTPNIDKIIKIKEVSGAFVETGGGIRSMEVVKRYIDAGIDRVILGTKAVEEPEFAKEAADLYGDKIAVGVDIKDGFVAVKGWTEKSALDAESFIAKMRDLGIGTIICTDISKDGMLQGTNIHLYSNLVLKFPEINIIASGGVTDIEDIIRLKELGVYGAIIGKAYYEKTIDLKEAVSYEDRTC